MTDSVDPLVKIRDLSMTFADVMELVNACADRAWVRRGTVTYLYRQHDDFVSLREAMAKAEAIWKEIGDTREAAGYDRYGESGRPVEGK